jgi:methionyl-tRNA formyltransferase
MEETAGEVESRLACLGAELMLKTLDGLVEGSLLPDTSTSIATLMPQRSGRLPAESSGSFLHPPSQG